MRLRTLFGSHVGEEFVQHCSSLVYLHQNIRQSCNYDMFVLCDALHVLACLALLAWHCYQIA